jgi:hypothetical protein
VRALKRDGRDLTPLSVSCPLSPPDVVFEGTREAWLQKIVETWRPYFQRLGYSLPLRIWVSVGRPPSSRSTGVCYPPEASDDANPHIFIHPVLSDSTRVAGTVVHQLCHAALGNRWHGQQFKKLATAVGLVGRMTRTIEGPLFLQVMPGIIDRYGPFPHTSLRQLRDFEETSGTRLLRITCPECGYRLRGTQRWLKVGVPTCPNPCCESYGEPMDIG